MQACRSSAYRILDTKRHRQMVRSRQGLNQPATMVARSWKRFRNSCPCSCQLHSRSAVRIQRLWSCRTCISGATVKLIYVFFKVPCKEQGSYSLLICCRCVSTSATDFHSSSSYMWKDHFGCCLRFSGEVFTRINHWHNCLLRTATWLGFTLVASSESECYAVRMQCVMLIDRMPVYRLLLIQKPGGNSSLLLAAAQTCETSVFHTLCQINPQPPLTL